MNSGYLFDAAEKLLNASDFYFSSEEVTKCVRKHAAAAAISSMAGGILPGVGAGIATTIAVGAVWAMYIKMSNIIGVNLEKKTLKVIASAAISNLTVGVAAMFITSFIPVAGSLVDGITTFAIVYTSAVVYLTCLTRIFKGQRTDLNDAQWKTEVDNAVRNMDKKAILKEGRNVFTQMKNDGSLNQEGQGVDTDPSDDEDY